MISVVICTYNRADLLAAALQTLCNQTLAACVYEVLIVIPLQLVIPSWRKQW